jgi:hypothetical protein
VIRTRGLAWLAGAAAMSTYVAAVIVAGALGADPEPLASSPAGVGRGEFLELLTSGLPVAGARLPSVLILAALATGLAALALARPGATLTGLEHACALAIGAASGLGLAQRRTIGARPRLCGG